MEEHKNGPIFSGASAEQVAKDLKPLVDFEEEGLSLAELRQLLEKRLFPHLMNYDCPAFQSMFNFIPEKGAKFGAVIAIQHNQGVTNWQVSPGGAMLEELCGRALCRLFGLARETDATFMYCGSYANQQALYLALHRQAEIEGFDLNQKGLQGFKDPSRLAVLTSEDAHLSLKHAVRMLGVGEQGLIPLKVDKNRRLDIENLKEKLDELDGKSDVFCVVATAGTTSTGSVDPIMPIAKLCTWMGLMGWLTVWSRNGNIFSAAENWQTPFLGILISNSVSPYQILCCFSDVKKISAAWPYSAIISIQGEIPSPIPDSSRLRQLGPFPHYLSSHLCATREKKD
jgi:aromatic-L-amino-acid decarboxylase